MVGLFVTTQRVINIQGLAESFDYSFTKASIAAENMQVTEDFGTSPHLISAYGEGYIRINKQEYRQNLILTPTQIIENWCDCSPAALEVDHFSPLDSNGLELILLGTGSKLVFPPPPLMQHFLCKKVGFEVMDLGAACRTYNVLLSEGRQVAAAILLS